MNIDIDWLYEAIKRVASYGGPREIIRGKIKVYKDGNTVKVDIKL